MAFNYTGLATTATSLIQRFGRTVQVLSKVQGGEPWNPTVSWESANAYAVSVGLNRNEVDGTLIQSTDSAYLVESSADITTDNRILDGTDEYSIVQSTPVKPGDTVMLYRIITRK